MLKWAGGKRRIAPNVTAEIKRANSETAIKRFFEPFFGMGAITIATRAWLKAEFHAGDTNQQLINYWQQIAHHLDNFYDYYAIYVSEYQSDMRRGMTHKEHFYDVVRKRYNATEYPTYPKEKQAALFAVLMDTCFNGMYRCNSDGKFGTPSGDRFNIKSKPYFKQASVAVEGVNFQIGGYQWLCRDPKQGDLFYFDPPYSPLSKTANFSNYCKEGFGEAEHQELALYMKELDKAGAKMILSNHDTPITRELYDGFNFKVIEVPRLMAGKANCRTPVNELIVTNF